MLRFVGQLRNAKLKGTAMMVRKEGMYRDMQYRKGKLAMSAIGLCSCGQPTWRWI